MTTQIENIIAAANIEFEAKKKQLEIDHALETVRSVYVWHYKNEVQKFEDNMIESIDLLVQGYIDANNIEMTLPQSAYSYNRETDIMKIDFATYSAAFNVYEYLDMCCASIDIIGISERGQYKYNIDGDEEYPIYSILVYNFYNDEYCG